VQAVRFSVSGSEVRPGAVCCHCFLEGWSLRFSVFLRSLCNVRLSVENIAFFNMVSMMNRATLALLDRSALLREHF